MVLRVVEYEKGSEKNGRNRNCDGLKWKNIFMEDNIFRNMDGTGFNVLYFVIFFIKRVFYENVRYSSRL